MDPTSRVMDAVSRAIAASKGHKGIHVCVRSPDDDNDIISFHLATFDEVRALAGDIEALGYELKLLHPILKQCDFVLEPEKRA